MNPAAAILVVTRAYQAQYADPIAFRVGDGVTVHRADTEYVGWYWCTNDSGKEGWVHQSYLSAVHGRAVGVKDYTAAELSVQADERVLFLDRSAGWIFVQRQDGTQGWVPETHVAAAD